MAGVGLCRIVTVVDPKRSGEVGNLEIYTNQIKIG